MHATLLLVLGAVFSPSPAAAALVELAFEGELSQVSDPNGLNANLAVGDRYNGEPAYDTDTPDITPEPGTGRYFHAAPRNGPGLWVTFPDRGVSVELSPSAGLFVQVFDDNPHDAFGASPDGAVLFDGLTVEMPGPAITALTLFALGLSGDTTALASDGLPPTLTLARFFGGQLELWFDTEQGPVETSGPLSFLPEPAGMGPAAVLSLATLVAAQRARKNSAKD